MIRQKLKNVFITAICLLIFGGCVGGGGDCGPNTDTNSSEFEYPPVDLNYTDTNSSKFEYPPVDLSKIEFILPMGGMIGNHVTPIDHQYYVTPDFGWAESRQVDVYSPADGKVTSIQHMGNFDYDDYRFVVEHSATLSSVYIHVDLLSDQYIRGRS